MIVYEIDRSYTERVLHRELYRESSHANVTVDYSSEDDMNDANYAIEKIYEMLEDIGVNIRIKNQKGW